MKKLFKRIVIAGIIFTLCAFVLTRQARTKQGINYRVHTKAIPLYLKLLDFYDRHYNYRVLVDKIIAKNDGSQQRAKKLLAWVYDNIRQQPKELPVIDDHVWHIIVRGYGTAEQFSDVFCTLATYAGMPSFFSFIGPEQIGSVALSFVRVEGSVFVFDPYREVYFVNSRGAFAGPADIAAGDWKAQSIAPLPREKIEYGDYLENISSDMLKYSSSRPMIQSPWQRLKRAVFTR